MKRLFRIGSGLFIYSIVPIASWLVLAVVLGDSRISNVFSITYPIQFVWAILKQFFGTGANIRKEKEKNQNSVWNSIFWGTIISFMIFSIPFIFANQYISFFGQDTEFYRIFVMYSITLLFLQTLFSFIIEKLYFEDKEKLANVHLFAFNLITFGVVIILSLLIKQTWIALLITLIVLFVYIVLLYIKQFEKFKIDFSFIKNFKYESANIVSNIFMLLIYLFGFKNAFSAGQEYLIALTLVGLCTDTQWDTLAALSIVAKVDISKNRYDYKKEMKNAYLFSMAIILSSIVMVFSLFRVYNVVLEIALVYLIFQVLDMILYPYKSILQVFTQLEYSPIINTILTFTLKAVRFIISIVIISPYCTEIGQITAGTLAFLTYLIIRILKFKVVNGKLVVNSKREEALELIS